VLAHRGLTHDLCHHPNTITQQKEEHHMSSTLLAVAFDCEDARALGKFWADVLGRPLDADASEDFASIGFEDRSQAAWFFIKVPEGKSAKNRVHPDLVATDRDAEVARLTSLGAKHVADIEEGGHAWTTLLDPEGNEFDIIAH
jgi:catechol 2,3-dioxygenase-like lactoylglutathione lyase family enzyme